MDKQSVLASTTNVNPYHCQYFTDQFKTSHYVLDVCDALCWELIGRRLFVSNLQCQRLRQNQVQESLTLFSQTSTQHNKVPYSATTGKARRQAMWQAVRVRINQQGFDQHLHVHVHDSQTPISLKKCNKPVHHAVCTIHEKRDVILKTQIKRTTNNQSVAIKFTCKGRQHSQFNVFLAIIILGTLCVLDGQSLDRVRVSGVQCLEVGTGVKYPRLRSALKQQLT